MGEEMLMATQKKNHLEGFMGPKGNNLLRSTVSVDSLQRPIVCNSKLKLDGHYDHWCMLMNFLRSKEYWNLIEQGIPTAETGAELTEEQRKDTTKSIWDSLKQKYQGTTWVQHAQRQAFRKEFEMLNTKVGESVNEHFAQTLTITNKMRVHGKKMEDVVVIEKISRSMTPKFDYVVCSIEESNDLDTLSIDVLQSSLLETETKAHYAEASGEILLIVHVDVKEASKEELWFPDSGCSNHMCGKKELFSKLDESFSTSVITEVFYVPGLKNNLLSLDNYKRRGLQFSYNMGNIWTFKLQWLEDSLAEKTGEWTATISSSFEVHVDICGPINLTSNSKKRSPTLVVKDMTPEEAWSGSKPSVDHFWVFGCISHVHILDSKRIKLDDKSVRCVLLEVSEESKAYRLYNLVFWKIIVNRDVKFKEENSWDWNKSHEEAIIADLD
ncbi:Retrovirus-related Pol polyprotein from transposon TNT 1-94 [Vitis vinifera]|uniref:Retrovirus-related Pol polyprotein from transposon TNT 1-94 n=1 Tax=Vitis vinifera TaxID=29760 RepID=A0A438CIQ9_VITVI|nr:Retrovirus-related Pol polyprotein from transposon TNT 1-94 [Vitis vinifera]